MNCGNSGLSSSSEDSSSTSKSLQVQPSLDSPSFSPPSFVDSQPTFSLSPTKALLPFTTPPLSSMPPLPDLVVRTPPRRGSTASSTSSSSFSSYNSQHHNPPPLPPLPAIYSISRKPLPEEFRPEVQQVKQLEDKRARTRALLAAQALPSPPRKTEPRRRSTAPLASRVRVALEENWVGVDTTRERIVPTRRGAGDRTSSFGALEDARKNLARRSGFGIPLPTTTSSSRPQLSITNKSSRSSCLQDDSSVPPPPSPESGPSAFPPPQEPNLPSPDHISRFHPQRSQSTPAAGRDSPSSLHSAPSIASFRSRARTVSFAESPVHIDNDPFSIESEDEEEGSGAGLEEKRKDGGGWWKKGKKRVQSIFSPRASPPSTTTLENSTTSPSTPSLTDSTTNSFQRFFRPPSFPYSNSSKMGGSVPDLRTSLSKTESSGSVQEEKTEERRKSVFDSARRGERGAVGGKAGRAVQLTEAQIQRRLGRMEDEEERRVAESMFL